MGWGDLAMTGRDRLHFAFAIIFSALAAVGVTRVGTIYGVYWDHLAFPAVVVFFGALALMIPGVERLSDNRARKTRAVEAGWGTTRDFERDQRERLEVAIMTRAGELYWGLPAGTTFEDACRQKAATGDATAKHYLRLIEDHRRHDQAFGARPLFIYYPRPLMGE
jgi:hypothetical protein